MSGGQAPAQRPAPPDSDHPAAASDIATVADLTHRRRNARRAAWRTWHDLHAAGLVCPVVEQTLRKVIAEAG